MRTVPDSSTPDLSLAVHAVDRERVLLVPAGPLPPGTDCALCPPALAPVAAAEVLLRYVDRRLRRRVRRVPLCRACWCLEVVRVLGDDGSADVCTYVPRRAAA